ncbi:hypothetical protein DYBT9623_02284 [Dyadobacter sp. CECT 9623]|jgi:hypothetical protein|uniref:Uncharacterized protein n=1 Tax=Dyadobacter linearis TaxID=2823330 RepID=A0ABN7R8S9_9BACT|nr:hypothetical protein DYBT9623_02284 [Dyadobacter sp. CECT 9623]
MEAPYIRKDDQSVESLKVVSYKALILLGDVEY